MCTGHQQRGLWLLPSYSVCHALGSAAPTAGLQALIPKLDPAAVSIFLRAQGWDLAADSLKELLDVNGILRAGLHHDGTYGFSVLLSVLQGHLPEKGRQIRNE